MFSDSSACTTIPLLLCEDKRFCCASQEGFQFQFTPLSPEASAKAAEGSERSAWPGDADGHRCRWKRCSSRRCFP